VERAAAALAASEDTILHVELHGEQRNADGSVVTWRSESWQLGGAPYTRRQIEVGHEGIRAEIVTRGDTIELYDARANTIYVASRRELAAARPLPEIIVAPGGVEGTEYVVEKGGYAAIVESEEEAERLRRKLLRVRQEPAADGPVEEPFRAEVLTLLESGRARETGRVEVGGREAIRIESSDGKHVYLVDATTFAPIEWTTTGNGGGVTLRFPVYEELPGDAESMKLLDLTSQYPGAKLEHDLAAFQAAEARLFPHG
jgi:hypothetical protein